MLFYTFLGIFANIIANSISKCSMRRLLFIFTILLFSLNEVSAKEVMRYRRYTTADGLIHTHATTFTQDKDGFIWIGTRSGMCRFDGTHFEAYSTTASGKKIGWIRKLRMDKDGRTLLMKINDNRYARFNPATRELTMLNEKIDLGDQALPEDVLRYTDEGLLIHYGGNDTAVNEYVIKRITSSNTETLHCENFIDRQGNMWVNFDNSVVQISFSDIEYNIYNNVGDDAKNPFSADVRSICKLADGSFLISTKALEVIRYNADGRFMGYMDSNGQLQPKRTKFIESVYNIQQDGMGRVWFAMRTSGIACLDMPFTSKQKLYHYTKENTPELKNNSIFDIFYSTKTGKLWIGTWGGGVSIIDTKSPRFSLSAISSSMKTDEKTQSMQVRRICELGDSVAVCTNAGLLLCDQNGKHLSHIGDIDISGVVRVGGVLYAGAYSQGLFTVENGDLKQFDIPGLGDCIHSIVPYSDSQILLTNPDCLLLYDTKRGSIRHFNYMYFGENVNFSEAQAYIDGNTLYAGMASGILVMPLVSHRASYVPGIIIANSGTTIGIGGEVMIKPDVMDYRIPRTVSYAWREKGDSIWHYVTDGKEGFTMSWLMPGWHTIEIRSTNAMGEWVDNITEAEFYVAPSWWQWCIIFVLVALLIVIAILIYKVMHPKLITSSDTAIDTASDIFPSAPDVTPYDRQLAKMLVENIEREIGNATYDVEQLAADMGMSRSQLYTQCKETLQKTPAAFILEIRMKRAMQLIETHQLRINEIAYKVGFADPKYFAKVFKKRVGMSPTKYASSI